MTRRAVPTRPGDLIDFDLSGRWRLSGLNTREVADEYFHDGKVTYGHVLVVAVHGADADVLVYVPRISPLWVYDAYRGLPP